MRIATCSLCGEEIFEADRRTMHKQVVSWYSIRRGARSGQAKFSHDTGAFAHGRCVEEEHSRQKRGLPSKRKQSSLF